MKRTVKFWTDKEINRIKEVYKQCNSQIETGRTLQKELGRTAAAIQMRASKIFGKSGASRTPRQEKKGVNLPAGFTFDIKPTRVVMFNDHVRLYF